MEETTNGINRMLNWLFNEELWLGLSYILIKIMVIVLIAGIAVKVAKKLIANVFAIRAKSPLRVSERREATILKLLQNVVAYFIYFIAITTILGNLDVDVKGLIAGAGIVGLAVGFGAQSLVKDVITGFFIIFEDQFAVGDYIRIGQIEGTVQMIGLRTTKITSTTGEVNIIPNGNIMGVTNFSINNSVAILDIGIAYEGNIDKAEKVINEVLEKMPEKYEELVGTPKFLGIQNLAPSEVVLRIWAETLPMQHFYISRELRRELKEALDANGIEIPYPRMVMYNRNDVDGKVQASRQ